MVDKERQNTVLRRKRKREDDHDEEQEAKNVTNANSTSPSSLYRAMKRLKLTKVASQALTEARMTACSDPRATFTWLAINVALCGHLAAPYKWNMDPTTFQVDERGLLAGKQLFYLLDRHLRTDSVERQKRAEEDKQIKLIAA